MCAAASDNIQRQKIALLIGNNNYNKSPLINCVNDANDLSAALTSIGFTSIIKINLKYKEMLKTIEDFVKTVQKNDIVVFFFSGHGIQRAEKKCLKNYLIPCDDDQINDLKFLERYALNAEDILDWLLDCRPFLIVFLLDCCRTYSLPKVSTGKSEILGMSGMAPMTAPIGTLIAYACAPNEIARDHSPNGRNGMFTYHLVKNITRDGDIVQLLRHVSNEVANDTNDQQIPHTTFARIPLDISLASPKGNPPNPNESRRPVISSATVTPQNTISRSEPSQIPKPAPKRVAQEFKEPGTYEPLGGKYDE